MCASMSQPTRPSHPPLTALQVAASSEEVVQNITVVDQLQDALADTVSESHL
jgi:tRNA C32,U32 (ribose-2'-O)-methylase TrmJ